MSIPFKYNLRNLFRRRLRSGLTLLGIALVIAAVVIMLAFSRGMLASIRNNGDPDNIIFISKKASDRVFSSIKKGDFAGMASPLVDRIAIHTDADGGETELIAPYIHHTANLEGTRSEAIIMGVDPDKAPLMHRGFKMVAGRTMDQALGDEVNEGKVLLVGALAYARLGLTREELSPGRKLTFNDATWEIVGIFSIPGTSMESEIWTPLSELANQLHREDYSFGIIRAKSPEDTEKLAQDIDKDERFPFKATTELVFFAGHAGNFNLFVYIALAMALMITVGGVMAGMNTMYTSIQGRIREFGTLQVLGFSKGAIIKALLMESALLTLLGGALGCLLGSLVNGLPVQVTMGAFLFKVDGLVIGGAMVLALLIGLLGALIPAWRAMRLRMVDAMRYN